MSTLLETVKQILPKKYPEHWASLGRILPAITRVVDISSAAKAFIENPCTDFEVAKYLIARPVGYPYAVWFEYYFPSTYRVGNMAADISHLAKHRVGVLACWEDNTIDNMPQTLAMSAMQEQPDNQVWIPVYVSVPIGRDGRRHGNKHLYALDKRFLQECTRLGMKHKDTLQYADGLVMPVLLHLNVFASHGKWLTP